ncbi:MAG: tRNA-dihydrouridine synthase family protein, partial [Nanoarchaeota archaeon]
MFRYMLAPLEDTSDDALRTLCHRHGADLTFTEMTRLSSLARNNKSTWEKISSKSDTPTVIQIAALKEDELRSFLDAYVPQKGFAGFNLNLGCPSPQLVRLGMGCAQMKRVEKTRRLVAQVKDRGYPCSIKMRLGANRFEKEKKVYLNVLGAVDADFFVVHARHGGQHYESPADSSVYESCVATGRTIIANGDITSGEQIAHLKEIGVGGAMIGRAAVRFPAIFDALKGRPTPSLDDLKEEYLALSRRFGAQQKYRENVLKRLGTQITTVSENG